MKALKSEEAKRLLSCAEGRELLRANLGQPAADVRKPLDENWMRVAPGTDAAIWRPWGRETGEL